jgi:hypothetical protein
MALCQSNVFAFPGAAGVKIAIARLGRSDSIPSHPVPRPVKLTRDPSRRSETRSTPGHSISERRRRSLSWNALAENAPAGSSGHEMSSPRVVKRGETWWSGL